MKKLIKWTLTAAILFTLCEINMTYPKAESRIDSGSSTQRSEHISETYKRHKKELIIDADKIIPPDKVYTGTVIFSDISLEQGKKLYGDIQLWTPSDFLKEGETLKYGDENIYLMADPENHTFYFEDMNETKNVPESKRISQQDAHSMTSQAISDLNINAKIIGPYYSETEPEGIHTYILGGEINGLPVASMSSVYSNGSVEITGNQFTYFSYSRHYTPEQQEIVELLDFSEILKKVRTYIEAGFIDFPAGDSYVSIISLEYYVDHTSDGLNFYPVWNFQIPSADGITIMLGRSTNDLFYINAVDGMLVKTMLV